MPDDLHKNGDFNDGATINTLCNNCVNNSVIWLGTNKLLGLIYEKLWGK